MLNERISQNSMAGSVRVIRYLLTALSTSFIGAGLVRFRLYAAAARFNRIQVV